MSDGFKGAFRGPYIDPVESAPAPTLGHGAMQIFPRNFDNTDTQGAGGSPDSQEDHVIEYGKYITLTSFNGIPVAFGDRPVGTDCILVLPLDNPVVGDAKKQWIRDYHILQALIKGGVHDPQNPKGVISLEVLEDGSLKLIPSIKHPASA